MPSSTSPSKPRPGRLTRRLLTLAFVGWLGCAAYTLYLNPSVRLWLGAARIKQAWAEKMGREHKSKVLVYGGSSCAFSINGERILEEQGLPVVNMGLGAGFGALHQPGLLCDLDGPSPLSLASQLLMLRPDGNHIVTLMAKIAGGKPLFRYRIEDINPSGWMQTAVRLPVDSPGPAQPLSAQGRQFLKSLAEWCSQRDVRLAYSIPWEFTKPDDEVSFQKQNAAFLSQVADLMPVLKDTALGVCTNREYYADTGWHLTEQGSNLRSHSLGLQIKEWSS